jgi:hypothetical protein
MRKYLIIIGLFLTVYCSGQLPGVVASQSAVVAAVSEMITNGVFADASDWTVDGEWSIGGGVASHTGGGVYSYLSQSQSDMVTTLAINTNYRLEFDIVSAGGMRLTFFDEGVTGEYVAAATYTTGHHIVDFTTGGSVWNNGFNVRGSVEGDAGTIDNISLKLQ